MTYPLAAQRHFDFLTDNPGQILLQMRQHEISHISQYLL